MESRERRESTPPCPEGSRLSAEETRQGTARQSQAPRQELQGVVTQPFAQKASGVAGQGGAEGVEQGVVGVAGDAETFQVTPTA